MSRKMIIFKKRFALMTAMLIFASLMFVNMKGYSAQQLKNVGALDSGIVVCAGGGNLDCRGFAAQVILWIL